MKALLQNKEGVKVLVAGSILQLCLGIIYVWSVFVIPVSKFFTWEVSEVKLTASFMLCFFVLGILVGGKLQTKMCSTKIVLLGGILLFAGMLGSAFIPQNLGWVIYITYGVISGFGVGNAYNAIISAAQKWFPENRGFATGCSVCAFGFSAVVFAPLIEWLIKQYQLKNTFIILAILFIVTVLLLFRFIKMPNEAIATNSASAKLLNTKQYTTTEMLKTKEFYFITLSLMLATSVFFILNPSFKTLALERGLSPSMATLVVMITGVANSLGRLGAPLLSDQIGREKAAMTIIGVTAVGAAVLYFAQGMIFIALIAIVAFCYGGFSGIYPVITADYFGIKNVGSNYGAVMVGFATSALVFPIIINTFVPSALRFFVLSGLGIIGVILVVALAQSKKQNQKQSINLNKNKQIDA